MFKERLKQLEGKHIRLNLGHDVIVEDTLKKVCFDYIEMNNGCFISISRILVCCAI